MDTLEVERQVQRSRRIIFPKVRDDKNDEVNDVADLKERLEIAKEQERLAKLELREVKLRSEEREEQLKAEYQRLYEQAKAKHRILGKVIP
eukprot:CAMPEP_0172497800 /NCGR_PEP_ID=MMETSP1066-20121228/105438_1 /TAXON_ID=671091 /ORGANISM="Coscinodiscus wailesii, Strain CCMP2513" /LENGTH=90 /DNA_ID=CAMNT_0013270773 /DNA_START=167 /DNA_END=439 /DNA_ORIENTATION=+